MSLDSDLNELARIPIFAALEYEARRLLAFSSETRILRAGDVLLRKGERSDCGYLLVNGTLELTPNNKAVESKIIRPTVLIGELALLTETERPSTVTAVSPSTVLKISRNLFLRVLREHPRSASQARNLIESRLRSYARDLGETRAAHFLDPKEFES